MHYTVVRLLEIQILSLNGSFHEEKWLVYLTRKTTAPYSDCRITLGIMDFKSEGTKSKNKDNQALKQHIMNWQSYPQVHIIIFHFTVSLPLHITFCSNLPQFYPPTHSAIMVPHEWSVLGTWIAAGEGRTHIKIRKCVSKDGNRTREIAAFCDWSTHFQCSKWSRTK